MSVYFHSVIPIIKGAVCSVLRIPTGKTTKKVKESGKKNSGTLSIHTCGSVVNENHFRLITGVIQHRISDASKFRIIDGIPWSDLKNRYGDAIDEDTPVLDNSKLSRVVILEDWNISCTNHPIMFSTDLINRISIEKWRYTKESSLLEINFTVHANVCLEPMLAIEEMYHSEFELPPLNRVLPFLFDDQIKANETVTPWEVHTDTKIDYNALIKDFGCSLIPDNLLQQLAELQVDPSKPLHEFLRRRIFFSHRDLEVIVSTLKQRKQGCSPLPPFFLYTGRGPSSESLHIGHLVPFMFTKWLQDAFDVPCVIQLTDDEKFLFKENLSDHEVIRLARHNARDIIACGFNVRKTFIFSDFGFMGGSFYRNIVKIQKCVTNNQVRGVFGFTGSHNIGQNAFCAVQAAPAFSSTFPFIFRNLTEGSDGELSDSIPESIPCLIPCAIDQDPYFRLTRDVAPRLGYRKPALVYSTFIPALQGFSTKMSGSVAQSSIYVTDTSKTIDQKIKKYCFSGGAATAEEQRTTGADLTVDVAYEYLKYFLEDDGELERIGRDYSSGRMLTSEVKTILVRELTRIVEEHQRRRALVTDELLDAFMATTNWGSR